MLFAKLSQVTSRGSGRVTRADEQDPFPRVVHAAVTHQVLKAVGDAWLGLPFADPTALVKQDRETQRARMQSRFQADGSCAENGDTRGIRFGHRELRVGCLADSGNCTGGFPKPQAHLCRALSWTSCGVRWPDT